MNRKYTIIILSVFILIAIFIGYGFWNYFQYPQGNELYKGMFIFIVSSIFLIIFFNLSYNSYKYLFFVSLVIIISLWAYNFVICRYFLIFTKLAQFQWGFIKVFTMCCIAPFFSVQSLFLITKYEQKFESNVIKGKYHMHEGFAGIILILIAIGLCLIRLTWVPIENKIPGLFIIGTFIVIIITLLIDFGGFLIGRDWKDVISLKFLALNSTKNANGNENESKSDDKNKFYTEKPLNTYLIGIILTSTGFYFIIFTNDIFPYIIFYIHFEVIRIIGWFILSIGAILIGYDWVRLLQKFFPDDYGKLNQKLENKVK